MTCELAHLDGAYVLGALSPAERLAFERHLPSCAACSDFEACFGAEDGLTFCRELFA